jgi:hypothetical protein
VIPASKLREIVKSARERLGRDSAIVADLEALLVLDERRARVRGLDEHDPDEHPIAVARRHIGGDL